MKYIILIAFFISAKFCFGQNLVFSNQNLKDILLNENCVDLNGDEFGDSSIDLNNDGEIQITEANNVENMAISSNLTYSSIYDLYQFTNLKRLSIFGGNGLLEISNLNLVNLEHIRISDFNTITNIDLSDLSNLNSIFIEGLNGLQSLNVQNGSFASENFSLFYTYFNSACVDPIMEEYDIVAMHILNGGLPTTNCSLDISESLKEQFIIYPNPSNDEIKIKTNLLISKVIIYDMNGKIVDESLVPHKTLNIRNLKNGIYLLIIETENGNNYNHKIVVK
jgi:hypothetical protein